MTREPPYEHLAHVGPWQTCPLVFVTVTIARRRRLLDNPVAHQTLRGIWERSSGMNGWFVGDYLLMPDHVHFFARSASEADPLSKWVKMWKSVSGRVLIKELNVSAPVWQEDYFDRFLRSAESYGDKWAYVEQNPVRAGLVAAASDWPYRGRIHELAM